MPIYNNFGYITIDDARIDETCNAYFKWKDLNTYIKNNSRRGINMPDAVCLIKTKYGIRKMTPRECFNTRGFPKEFKLPEDMSDGRLYKQAGNSVCVSVIARIAEKVAEATK